MVETVPVRVLICLEGVQRLAVERIDVQVPRAERLDAEALAALLVEALGCRDDDFLNRFVEAQAVVGRVVEAVELAPAKGAVIGHVGVGGDLQPQLEETRPQLVEGFAVGKLTVGDGAPCRFTLSAIRVLLHRLHLRDGLFFAVPLNGLRADDLVVLGAELALLGEQRHVLFAEEFGVGAHIPQFDLVALRL